MALRHREDAPASQPLEAAILLEDPDERYRRYGMMNHFEDTSDRYRIVIEFPRWVPPAAFARSSDLPREMPDYEYQIRLEGDYLFVEARLTDPRFKEITDRTSSFPSGFELHFHVPRADDSVEERYQDKKLEIIVPKR